MAFTFAGQYTEAILATGSSGATLLPALPAHVYAVGTTTHVTLYTSRTKGTTASNPVTTDVNGNLTFFVDPGPVDIVFTPVGGTQKRVTVTIPADAAEGAATYKPFPATASTVRWVSPTGSDSNNGLSDGTAFLTAAAAEAAVPAGGVIMLTAGTHTWAPVTFVKAKSLIGPSRRTCILSVPAGATGSAITMTTDGANMRGFQVQASAASGTLTSGIHLGSGQLVDDVIISNAPTAIDGTACGSSRIGASAAVEIYDHTGYAININGDGGLEVTFGKVTITRTVAGAATGGISVTRTSNSDKGGIYLDAVIITAGSGTYGIGLNVTSSVADTRLPVRIGPLCVIDAAGTTCVNAQNINLLDATGVWMDTAPNASARYAVTLVGCGTPHFVGCYVVGTPTGGAFDITGGTNPGVWHCIGDQGTLLTVHSASPPTGIQYGGNRGYPTLTNDAATLTAAVNVTDFSGLAVTTSQSAGSGVFQLKNDSGGAAKYFRVTNTGVLQLVNGAFSSNILTIDDTGLMGVNGDLYANHALNHLGTFLKFFNGTGGSKATVSGSRGGNAALASLLSALANYGLITDSTTA